MAKKIMTKKIIATAFVLFLALSAFNVGAVVDPLGAINQAANSGGYVTTGEVAKNDAMIVLVADLVGYLLTLLGAAFLILIIYAGTLWMFAAGNEEQVTKAKALIKNGIIGLAIILGSGLLSAAIYYLLWRNVMSPA